MLVVGDGNNRMHVQQNIFLRGIFIASNIRWFLEIMGYTRI